MGGNARGASTLARKILEFKASSSLKVLVNSMTPSKRNKTWTSRDVNRFLEKV
jgi:hypothetical protein